ETAWVTLSSTWHTKELPHESRNPGPDGFGVFPMRTFARTLGGGPYRRELGVGQLQAGVSKPDDGQRGSAIGLVLWRILDSLRCAHIGWHYSGRSLHDHRRAADPK